MQAAQSSEEDDDDVDMQQDTDSTPELPLPSDITPSPPAPATDETPDESLKEFKKLLLWIFDEAKSYKMETWRLNAENEKLQKYKHLYDTFKLNTYIECITYYITSFFLCTQNISSTSCI